LTRKKKGRRGELNQHRTNDLEKKRGKKRRGRQEWLTPTPPSPKRNEFVKKRRGGPHPSLKRPPPSCEKKKWRKKPSPLFTPYEIPKNGTKKGVKIKEGGQREILPRLQCVPRMEGRGVKEERKEGRRVRLLSLATREENLTTSR